MKAPLGYTVFVDGYNLIKRHPAWCDLSLPQARGVALANLQQIRWPFPVRKLVIVFDAQENRAVRVAASGSCDVEIRYATPSADAAIEEAVRQSQRPESLIVISDDRAIQHTAKSHSVAFYPSRWLFRCNRAKRAFSSRDVDAAEKLLPGASARMITEELARRWLG